jgi:hypothetical protein
MLKWYFRAGGRFYIAAATIFFAFMLATGLLAPSDYARSFQLDSDALVTQSVAASLTKGVDYLGGFMGVYGPSQHRRVIALVDPARAQDADVPYVSQYGLQYKIIASLGPGDPARLPGYFQTVQVVLILLMALVMAAFVTQIREEFGFITGSFVTVELMLSPLPMLFAKSLYWDGFLLFLPFVILFAGYGKVQTVSGKVALMGAFGVALFAKFLCGYEYVTAIAGSAAASITYHELRRYARIGRIVKPIVLAGLVAAVAFAAAMGLHYIQALHYFGTPELAWRALTLPARYNSIASEGIRNTPVTFHTVGVAIYYLMTEPTLLNLSIVEVGGLGALAVATVAFTQPRRPLGADQSTAWLYRTWCLAAATAVGGVASFSWLVAIRHVMGHPFLSTIMLFLPLLPMAYALIAALFARAFGSRIPWIVNAAAPDRPERAPAGGVPAEARHPAYDGQGHATRS